MDSSASSSRPLPLPPPPYPLVKVERHRIFSTIMAVLGSRIHVQELKLMREEKLTRHYEGLNI